MNVSTKGFGRPRAFRVEKARSASIMSRCAAVRQRAGTLKAFDERVRQSGLSIRIRALLSWARSAVRSARFVSFPRGKRAAARSFPR
jgi:hypothetical protein